MWKSRTSGESSVANESRYRPEYSKRNLPFYRHNDCLHHCNDGFRCHDNRLHDARFRQLTAMTTVFVTKNCAPHDGKSFFLYKEPEFATIRKGSILLLTKQYYTIRRFGYLKTLPPDSPTLSNLFNSNRGDIAILIDNITSLNSPFLSILRFINSIKRILVTSRPDFINQRFVVLHFSSRQLENKSP